MSHLIAGRAQTGTSLAFHLSFAVFGVGLPVMMLAAEGLHLRIDDPVWLTLARRCSKAFAFLFAIGAVSRTTVSFELGLLAILLGLGLYGWGRLSPRAHWLVPNVPRGLRLEHGKITHIDPAAAPTA